MKDSEILEQAVDIEAVSHKNATHFALCDKSRIRYLISVNGGKKRLSSNLSTYSNKLRFLMWYLEYFPLSTLAAGSLGYFVKATLHPAIMEIFSKTDSTAWNMIAGTYNEKQKLVFQCFNSKRTASLFIKVGNKNTNTELLNEIDFLNGKRKYSKFNIPKLVDSKTLTDQFPFNILVTKEFAGDKVKPVMTDDIYGIYHEISGRPLYSDDIDYEFSHGDFAPWNIKKGKDRYIVFDWEHCGVRFRGYDLIHYTYMIERKLHHKSEKEAIQNAIKKAIEYDPWLGNQNSQELAELFFNTMYGVLGSV
ncbi:hypothetical protein [Diplocloster hominis]|uniref:hypothetical protein n=1 Tax=Diplocloster hominis TaxID=3079010 RepID=UPI0031BA9C78